MPNKTKLILALLVFAISFGFYFSTLAPDVYWEDAGELITAAVTLGIAHTPGHPLYVVVGKLASFVHPNAAFALNLLSALLGSAAATVLFLSLSIFLGILFPKQNTTYRDVLSALLAFVFSISLTFWSLSVHAEVYTLQALFTALVLWAVFRWHSSGSSNWLVLTAFLLGLGLTNNITLFVMVIAVFLFVLLSLQKDSLQPGLPGYGLLFFILGLSFYLYLPIRSGLDPFVDWGNPESWDQFVWMLTMQEYAAGVGSTYAAPDFSIVTWLGQLIDQFSWVGLVVGLVGWLALFIRFWKAAIFLSVIILINTGFAFIAGAGPDFEAYFVTTYISFTFFVGVGLFVLLEWLQHYQLGTTQSRYLVYAIPIILVGGLVPILIILNYPLVDRSQATEALTFANILDQNLPQDAVFVTDNTVDHFLLMYLQGTLDRRSDIVNVYTPLLKFNWYRQQIASRHPDINVADYRTDADLTDPRVLQDLVQENYTSHELFYSTARDWHLSGHLLMPYGYVFKISTDSLNTAYHFELKESLRPQLGPHADDKTRTHFAISHTAMGRLLWARNERTAGLREMEMATEVAPNNAEAHFNLAAAYESLARYDSAIREYERALELDPESSIANFRVGVAFANMGLFQSAATYMEKAIALQPENADYWYHLGLIRSEERQLAESLEAFDRAIQFRSDFAEAYYQKGLLLRRRERLTDSADAFRRATEIRPSYLEAWLELGSNLLRLNNFDEALSVFQQAVELDPENPYAWFTLARVHAKRDDPANVQAALKQAIALGGTEIVHMARVDPILKKYYDPNLSNSADEQ